MRFKSILTIAFIVTFSISSAAAAVIDEMGGQQQASGKAIPNRPMRDDANLQAVQTAFDKSDPRANIKRHPYDSNITYKIRLREFMGSTIVLPEGEKIAGYSLFDSHNFTFVPLSSKNPALTNVFDVYAKFHGADTNLTVHGDSGNIYSFYLRVDSVESKFMPSLVTYIDDPAISALQKEKAEIEAARKKALSAEAEEKKKEAEKNDYLKDVPSKVDSAKLDFNYKIKSGNEKIAPIRVYDDGYFTFFQFGENNLDSVKTLPTVYRVVDGYDTPVNTRISGGKIIAETLSKKWTLRAGSAHLCIWKKDND